MAAVRGITGRATLALVVLMGLRTMRAQSPDAPAAGAAAAPVRVSARVSARVMDSHILKQTTPQLPAQARAEHIIGGVVVLRVVISAGGKVEEATAISGPEALRAQAIRAIFAWRYRPYLLNGSAVAVETSAMVSFQQ